MKKILLTICAVVVIGAIIAMNILQDQQTSGKRNVYALLPLTGPMAQTGKDAKAVMDHYYKNGNYGFNLVYIDSETNPTKAITALQQKAINDDSPIVVAALSGVVSAVAPYVQQKNGFLYAITACNKDLPAFLRLHSDVDGMLEPTVSYIKNHYKNIAIVYVEDEFGRLERNYFTKRMEELSIPVYEVSIGLKTLDVRNEVLKVISKNPEAVVIMGVPNQGYINVMRELKTQEYKGQIFMDPAITSPHIRTQIPNDIMGTCLSLEAEASKNERQQQFQADLSNMNMPIYSMLIEAADVLNLIQHTLDNNLAFTQETYNNMKQWEGISGTIKFFGKGDTAYKYLLVRYKDGKFIPIESEER